MVKVIATSRGYFDGILRDPGTPSATFELPVDLWADKKRRPSWVIEARSANLGPKGDHDGDGKPGGSKGGSGSNAGENVKVAVAVSADWRSMSAADRKVLAGQIARKEVKKASDADAIIEAHVEATKPEPFGDAPQPQTIAEAQKEIGGIAPDWVAPGAPEPVTD